MELRLAWWLAMVKLKLKLRLQPSWPCIPCTTYCDCFADFGVEHAVPVNGLDSQAIESKLQELIKRGESLPRYLLQKSDEVLSASSHLFTFRCICSAASHLLYVTVWT